jgi:hypothetical protein
MIDAYIELKMEEVTRLRMTTHPVEFDMYYSCSDCSPTGVTSFGCSWTVTRCRQASAPCLTW